MLNPSNYVLSRASDDVVAVAKLCAAAGVPHVINNAYGVQSTAICSAITSACRKGRVDAIVQSSDKNFMVPVGGAVIAAPKKTAALLKVRGEKGIGQLGVGLEVMHERAWYCVLKWI